MKNKKVKFGYLTHEDMVNKVQSGELDEYDIIFSKTDNIIYIISENLEPIDLHSRVYVFESKNEAEIKLNEYTDTYAGQVVAILDNDKFRGYIVNYNTTTNKYFVVPLYEYPEPINYNTLGNRPIINLTGTLDNPLVISELDSGIYSIIGQYTISNLEETIYLSVGSTIFIIDKNAQNNNTKIKKITVDEITDYTIINNELKKSNYATEQYLVNNEYVTDNYVDYKIKALGQSIKDDIQAYVKDKFDEAFSEELDVRIDDRIKENIEDLSEDNIRSLFD